MAKQTLNKLITTAQSLLNHDDDAASCDVMKWYGTFSKTINAIACCCAGQFYLFNKANALDMIPGGKVADCGSLAIDFYEKGRLYKRSQVQPGDLVIFSWSKALTTCDSRLRSLGYWSFEHVELCVRVNKSNGTCTCIGCNNGGKECDDFQEKVRNISDISGCGRPDYATDSSTKTSTSTNNYGGYLVTDPNGSGKDRVFSFFKAKGLGYIQIAGIMGNVNAESGFRSDLKEFGKDPEKVMDPNDSTCGYGLVGFTWHQFKKDLKKLSDQYGITVFDMDLQLNYLYNSVLNPENPYGYEFYGVLKNKGFFSVGTPEEAAIIFHDNYERSAFASTVYQDRAVPARKFYNEYNGKSITVSVKSTDKPVPGGSGSSSSSSSSSGSIKYSKDVEIWQHAMNIGFDTDILVEDGLFGPMSANFAKTHNIYKGIQGCPTAVRWVQNKVGAVPDGIFGDETRGKVISYQKGNGLVADGIVGYNTVRKILNV